MSARVYFMKRVKDSKDVCIMSPQDEHKDGQVYSVCILQFSCFTKYIYIFLCRKCNFYEAFFSLFLHLGLPNSLTNLLIG